MDVTHAYRGLLGLYPPFRTRVIKIIAQANRETAANHPEVGHWLIIETFRHPERQAHLYAQGRTEPGRKVTWTLRSRHSSGLAVDIVPVRNDGTIWWNAPEAVWARLGHATRKHGMIWGGDWKQKDPPHIEPPRWLFSLWAIPAKMFLIKQKLL